MHLKGIIDYDTVNYKEPVLTMEMPRCDFKCDVLNGCKVCQNSQLAAEPDIDVSFEDIWQLYCANPLTKGFCFQGLEPFNSLTDIYNFVDFIRAGMDCNDVIIIYTGYNRNECAEIVDFLHNYPNIIIKWGRFIMNDQPHYDGILGVNLASSNQYAEVLQ